MLFIRTKIFFFIILCSSLALAEEKNLDAQQPITIFSDSAEFDDKTGIVVHYDQVTMHQGSRHLTSDTLIIERDDQGKIGRMIAIGKPAQFQAQPDLTKPLSHGKAYVMKYYPKEEKIILMNNAELTQKENVIQGPYLTYLLNTRVLSSESRSGQQTTIILPKEKKS